jgi:serine/threonine-protein kinase RsbW
MAGALELSLEADLDQLKPIRDFVAETGRSLGVPDDIIGDLCLVVDEAVTNVILHGYQGQSGPLQIQVADEGRNLVILIRDEASAFDANRVDSPHLDEPLAEREYGGMGVYLIRRLTDEAVFRSLPGGGNELRLVRRDVVPTS